MIILGINAYHGDSAAALLVDGRLVAAVEEERFNRVKHWAGFPAESVRYCLAEAGAGAGDIDHIAVSFNPRANLGRKALFALRHRPSAGALLDRLKRQGKGLGLREEVAAALGCDPGRVRAPVHRVEHHEAHVAGGFFVSPYERAAVLSVDGMGDFVSTLLASGEGNGFRRGGRVFHPHSLGFLYNALTLYLGFPAYGDEYKVMGLAPYGEPRYLEELRRVVRPEGDLFALDLDYFTHHREGISMTWEGGAPVVEPFHSPRLEELLGPARAPGEELEDRHNDIAASLQRVTEEIVFHLLEGLHRWDPADDLVVVGGVAMNSVANGKITGRTPFKRVYVPAGAADNGTSFGAAFYVWNKVLRRPRDYVLEDAYLGPSFGAEPCRAAAEAAGLKVTELDEDGLVARVVEALCTGEVVGWFQGRMEFAARALGNRSLLADPRRADMREIINTKIKFRERFRPFAPSILEERVGDYFETDAPAPFMEKVYVIREEKRAQIPAVTHVDGTGRLQSVSRETNPLYWKLISAFEARTGVPVVLNTSLNENEPIVHTPEQAVSCFLRTRMDALVAGKLYLERGGE